MPQDDIKQTYKADQFRSQNVVPADFKVVEFRGSDPTDLATNPKRVWARIDTGELKYTVDGVEINSVLDSTSVDEDIQKLQFQQVTNRGIQDSLLSVALSRTRYEDTASTMFIEDWNNLTSWTTNGPSGVQVSGNKLYSTGTGGGASGANHGISLSGSESLRAIFNVSIPLMPVSGGAIVGVSSDAAGGTPTNAGGTAFGLYFTGSGLQIMNNGATSTPVEGSTLPTGDYVVTVTVDETYISVTAVKTDGIIEAGARRLRAGFNVNNLYIFNSDSHALTGISIGKTALRKGLQTLTPRTGLEGITKTISWTGDGTQSYRVYLPTTYDSRIPAPVVMCFHGNGTNEYQWSINANMKAIQVALVAAGFIVLTCSLNSSFTTWGNTASTNAYYQAYKYLRTHYAIGSVGIYANSMGGIESLNTLSENRVPCSAWAGTVPTYDLRNNYDNAMFTSVIQAAYGIAPDGSDYSSKTAGRDPALMNNLTFGAVPMLIIGPNDDTAVSPIANRDALYDDVKDISLEAVEVIPSSGGHSFPIGPYTTQIVDFYKKYANS